MYKNNRGYGYELAACNYLTENNYTILERNFISKFGEVDIIASKDNVLIFVEVKGRKSAEPVPPREHVTLYKQRKIIMAAKYYLMKNNIEDVACRFDVIEIIADQRQLNHIEDAFGT